MTLAGHGVIPFLQPGADLRDAALAYAGLSMFVFPCAPKGKAPALRQGHGWLDATTKTFAIKKWWPPGSERNIGIALQPSNLVVIDIDPRNDGDKTWHSLCEHYDEPPKTYTVKTPGKGSHLYYRVPADFHDNSSYPSKLGPGVDFLGKKYVLAPPSQADNEQHYVIDSGDPEHFATFPFQWIEKIVASLAAQREESIWITADEQWTISKGQRNDTMTSIAGWARKRGASAKEIQSILYAFKDRIEGFAEVEDEIPTIAHSIGRRSPDNIRFQDMHLSIKRKVAKPVLDDVALHGILGEYVKEILPISEAHPAAIMSQCLAVFGNMIGARQHGDIAPGFSVEDAYHRTALYVTIVGDSAQAGKGDSWTRVQKLFKAVDPTWRYKTGIHTGEGLIEALADDEEQEETAKIQGERKHFVRKGGQRDRRYFIIEPEFGRVLHAARRQGSVIIDIYRSLWDNGSTEKHTASDHKYVSEATVSLVGHITRPELERDLDEVDLIGGFGNRFLWVYAERTQTLPRAAPLPKHRLKHYKLALQDAIDFAQHEAPGDYDFSEEGWEYWCDLVQSFKKGHPEDVTGKLFARDRAFVFRMAVIYAVADLQPQIEVEHLEAAAAFWRYCADSVEFIFGNRVGDPLSDKIYRELLANLPGYTKTEIHKILGNNKSSAQVEHSINTLMQKDMVYKRAEKRGKKSVDVFFARITPYEQS